MWADFAALVRRLAGSADWLTISGSLPAGAPGDGYVGLVGVARTAFDSAEAGIEGRPALVKVNQHEAARLTGVDDPAAAARILAESSAGAAVVTRGVEGAVAVDGRGAGWTATLDARGAYPVGSGDCFLAGMVVALDRGEPLRRRAAAGDGRRRGQRRAAGCRRCSIAGGAEALAARGRGRQLDALAGGVEQVDVGAVERQAHPVAGRGHHSRPEPRDHLLAARQAAVDERLVAQRLDDVGHRSRPHGPRRRPPATAPPGAGRP